MAGNDDQRTGLEGRGGHYEIDVSGRLALER